MPERNSMMLKFSNDLQAVKDEIAGNESVVDGYFLYTLCRRPDETSVHITSFGCVSDVDAMIGRLEILKKVMIQAYEADRENEQSLSPIENPDVLEILRNLDIKGKGN